MTQLNEPPLSDPLQILTWYLEMGVDEAIEEKPQNRLLEVKKAKKVTPKLVTTEAISKPEKSENPAPALSPDKSAQLAQDLADKANSLEELQKAIKDFEGLGLKKTAHTTVFSDGNPHSKLMIITDVPNADEDREGKPFVGGVGDLFDKMLGAIELTRDEDFYIASLLPWRVLGNRKPNDAEIAICLPFLLKHIKLVSPDVLVLMGSVASQSILDSKAGISQLRGKWQTLALGGKDIAVMPTFHPTYLLKQANAKKNSWADLLEIKNKLRAK